MSCSAHRNATGPLTPIGLHAKAGRPWERFCISLAPRLADGQCGLELARALAQRADEHIVAEARRLLEDWRGVALVAVGGFGRCQLAPGSDVDLLLLHGYAGRRRAEQLARALVPTLWDNGLSVGVATRTVRDCERMARADLSCLTNVLSARYLHGDRSLFARLRGRIGRWPGKRWIRQQLYRLAQEVLNRPSYPPVHILVPDLKEGAGGLRDVHRIGWFRTLVHGTPLAQALDEQVFVQEDALALGEAERLLWSLRWWLHLLRGSATNRLDRDVQVAIAERLGYRDSAQSRGVEKLMRAVYRSMHQVANVVRRVAAFLAAPTQSAVRPLPAVELPLGVYRNLLVPTHPAALRQARADLTAQVELLRLAAEQRLELGAELLRELLRAPTLPDTDRLPGRRAFWALLRGNRALGTLLRLANATGVLSRLMPEWEHVRGLVHFTEYHEYTVDEHSIVAVEQAAALANEQSTVADVYRALPHKQLLHLALLIHDLGKGYRDEHCVVGGDIARGIAHRFQLGPHETELLVFLVTHHLLLSQTAFRRDIEHPATLADVARKVGTAERLDLLYVLTVCDIRAAGPGRMTEWKMALLEQTYRRLRALLADELTMSGLVQRRRQELLALGRDRGEKFVQWVASLPPSYLLGTTPENVLEDYVRLGQLSRRSVEVLVEAVRPRLHRVTVYAYNRPRLFADIVTGLYVAGTSVIDARITTLPDGSVVDRFTVYDLVEDVTPVRQRRVRGAVLAAIHEASDPERLLKNAPLVMRRRSAAAVFDPEVRIDTTVSPEHTVIDVFFQDAPGVLYRLSRTIYALGLEIIYAKIAAYGERVVDVFYVVEPSGEPPRDAARLQRIRHELLATLRGLQAARHS